MKRFLILLLLVLVTQAPALAETAMAPRSGMLLVASEKIKDPRFRESVILIIRHDQKGTSGLILNRPLGKLPSELEGTLFTQPNVLFWGGPVSPLQVHALLFCKNPPEATVLMEGLYLLEREQIEELFHEKALESGELRVFLGYAGWAPRQLAGEISRGDWSVHPTNAPALKRLLPEQLWPTLVPNNPSPWI